MSKLINFEESSNEFDNIIAYNGSKGLKSVIFASRKFTLEEAKGFHEEYIAAKLSSIDQEGKLSQLARTMENHLKMESIIGFRNSMMVDSLSTVSMMKNMGLNVHILSGDSKENCLLAIQSLELCSGEDPQVVFNFTEASTGRVKMKGALEIISSNLSKVKKSDKSLAHSMTARFESTDIRTSAFKKENSILASKNLVVFVSGDCIELILRDKYLLDHFKFVVEFSKVVVGYDLSPIEKSYVIEVFKEMEKKTLAIGDGFNDVNMVQAANVGVQLVDKNVGYQFGDIVVDNLLCVATSMNSHCRKWNDNLHLCIHNLYGISSTYFVANLVHQIFCAATADSVLSSYYITISLTFVVLLSIYFIFLNDTYTQDIRKKIPGLYCERLFLTGEVYFNTFIFHIVALYHSRFLLPYSKAFLCTSCLLSVSTTKYDLTTLLRVLKSSRSLYTC